jgi:hypothetical protein
MFDCLSPVQAIQTKILKVIHTFSVFRKKERQELNCMGFFGSCKVKFEVTVLVVINLSLNLNSEGNNALSKWFMLSLLNNNSGICAILGEMKI